MGLELSHWLHWHTATERVDRVLGRTRRARVATAVTIHTTATVYSRHVGKTLPHLQLALFCGAVLLYRCSHARDVTDGKQLRMGQSHCQRGAF